MTRLKSLNTHRHVINRYLWGLAALPATYLAVVYLFELLPTNPFEYLMDQTGHWSMVFFLLSFAITPVRRWCVFLAQRRRWEYGKRLSDWNFLIFNRRMLGLTCFYYACVHFLLYFYFELDFSLEELRFDVEARTFVALGLLGWCILLILALTSPTKVQQILRKNWRKIHRLVYILAPILFLHIASEAKFLSVEVYIYLGLIIALLLHRILVKVVSTWGNKNDNGMEVKRK